MHSATVAVVTARDRDDNHHSIIADLRFLIEQVEASIARLDQAIGQEDTPENQDSATAMIILDDVTPSYRAASAALNACRIELGFAMQSLRDSGMPEYGTEVELVLGSAG